MRDISEASAPTKVQTEMLEADLQAQCVRWAKSRGYWARKFSSISQRSVPDYLFSKYGLVLNKGISANAKVKFACEFKRPGCKINKDTGVMSTQAQVDEQEAMRLAGWFVFECCDFSIFKRTVIAYENEV